MCARQHFVHAMRGDQRLNAGDSDQLVAHCILAPTSKLLGVGERVFRLSRQTNSSSETPCPPRDTGGPR